MCILIKHLRGPSGPKSYKSKYNVPSTLTETQNRDEEQRWKNSKGDEIHALWNTISKEVKVSTREYLRVGQPQLPIASLSRGPPKSRHLNPESHHRQRHSTPIPRSLRKHQRRASLSQNKLCAGAAPGSHCLRLAFDCAKGPEACLLRGRGLNGSYGGSPDACSVRFRHSWLRLQHGGGGTLIGLHSPCL